MTTAALLARLAGAGTQVRRDGDGLRIFGRTPPPDLLAELRKQKRDVLAALSATPRAVCLACGGGHWAREQGTADWRCVPCAHAAQRWTFRDPDEDGMQDGR